MTRRLIIDIENDADRLYADEARAAVRAERVEQGLPPTVTDPEAIAVLAAVLAAAERAS